MGGDGYLLDIKTDAKGLELQLDELKHRFWEHISKVYERLIDEFDKASKQQVFILNQSKKEDPNHDFLFTDKEILKTIHFKTFIRDCRAVEGTDHSSIYKKLEYFQIFSLQLRKQQKRLMGNIK